MLTSTWTDNKPPGLDAPRVVFCGVLVAEVDVAPRVAVQAQVDGDRVEDLLETPVNHNIAAVLRRMQPR